MPAVTAATERAAQTADAEAVHLRLQDLVKQYPGTDVPAVDRVNLAVPRGHLLALLGPSGCGKTTTLRMIAGLIDPTSGRIEVNGADLTGTPVHRRGMGMVFQSYALFPHMNVGRNVAFGLEMRRVPKAERPAKVAAALEMVQLGHLAERKVSAISGGQAQRVALARALVVQPNVLLLDEPLSNLDAKLRDRMRMEIREIQLRTGITTVFVTHDQAEALSMADVIAVMSAGRVEQVGSPEEIFERPSSRFVADFIGRANLLSGTVIGIDAGIARVDIPKLGIVTARCPEQASGNVTVMVRPHRIRAVADSDASAQVRGTVVATSYTGDLVSITVQAGDQRILAEAMTGPAERSPGAGTSVTLGWHTDDALVLTR